ncbi:hypothetical protein J5N97_004110 [Dioscorea zingiberensis]|uniref:Uncharacterized protein n=1 Tax=Dioscorea zingiberensis TaxID=325984 RepID=A0A9D5D6P1_9LILI|nr:hypothetical protein J5N97_004110 [Dioscorea zingiberensis]
MQNRSVEVILFQRRSGGDLAGSSAAKRSMISRESPSTTDAGDAEVQTSIGVAVLVDNQVMTVFSDDDEAMEGDTVLAASVSFSNDGGQRRQADNSCRINEG